MLAKVEKLYENVTIMIGEHRSTATGGNTVRITFSPEAREQNFWASSAKGLGEAVSSALLLKNALDELAAAQATIEEITGERNRIEEAQTTLMIETPSGQREVEDDVRVEAGNSAVEPAGLVDGADVAMFERSDSGEPRENEADRKEHTFPVAKEPSAETASPPYLITERQSGERLHLSRSAQSEIIREIVSHEDFIPTGRLEADNVSGKIKKRVQQRIGMSEEQWKNTFSALRQKKFITLETYPHNPKRSLALMIDVEAIAKAIEKRHLFSLEEDIKFKQLFFEMKAKELPVVTKKDQLQPQIPVTPQTSQSFVPKTPPPVIAAVAPSSRPAVALPKSGALRRAERYEQRQREEREAAQRDADTIIGGIQRRSVAEVARRDDIILPDYEAISQAEWDVMKADNEIKFLLALIHSTVHGQIFKGNADLLSAVVSAGRIDLRDNTGQIDPTILPELIKGLKKGSEPKINFISSDAGGCSLELTKAGKEYLATQFCKVQLAVIRAKEAA